MSCVYAIKSDTGLIKIGMTMGDPIARMASLQTGNPHVLTMFSSFEVSDYGIDPAQFEAAMHRRLAPFRVVGEWFQVPEWAIVKAFQITAAELHQPVLYARWERRFGRYCRMWLRRVTANYGAPKLVVSEALERRNLTGVASGAVDTLKQAEAAAAHLAPKKRGRPKGKTDRKAYQRELMRDRRAKLKNQPKG